LPQQRSRWFSVIVPDLVAEVIEPEDGFADVMESVLQWLAAGVRLVWVVDPHSRTVTVFPSLQQVRVLTEADTLDGGEVAPGFSLLVAEIFA
jgi:Uma2 family endonuclease